MIGSKAIQLNKKFNNLRKSNKAMTSISKLIGFLNEPINFGVTSDSLTIKMSTRSPNEEQWRANRKDDHDFSIENKHNSYIFKWSLDTNYKQVGKLKAGHFKYERFCVFII